MKNCHFIKFFDDICLDCNLNERIIFSYIVDRMNSSRQRSSFFDQNHNDFYVIYTIQELAKTIGISHDTISRALNKLVVLGYLYIERTKYHANKIFITEAYHYILNSSYLEQDNQIKNLKNTNKNAKSDTDQYAKSDTNQTNKNQTNILSNTHVSTKDIQYEQNTLEMDSLETTIMDKVGLSSKATHILRILSFNKPKVFKHYISLILKAKANVIKRAPGTTYCLLFDENNKNLQTSFNNHIYGIIMNANKKAVNKDKYIMKSLINFFEEHYNKYEFA